jgi:hypothetical protein
MPLLDNTQFFVFSAISGALCVWMRNSVLHLRRKERYQRYLKMVEGKFQTLTFCAHYKIMIAQQNAP